MEDLWLIGIALVMVLILDLGHLPPEERLALPLTVS